MKKYVLAILACIMICLVSAEFAGCVKKDKDIENDGEFSWLHIAYEQKWITKEDLKNIAFNYNTKNYDEKVNYDEDFQPIGLPVDLLSNKLKETIKKAFCMEYKINKDMYDEVTILSEYYGFFSNCYVVDISTTCLVGGDPVFFEKFNIDGIDFYNYHYIGVYRQKTHS